MDKYIKYIDESIESLSHKEQELIAGERKDEANLVKIRINIYGIAKSFYDVTRKSVSEENLVQEFERRIRKPAQAWNISYEKAKEHNDIEKCVIEEIKIKTLEEIINDFKKL